MNILFYSPFNQRSRDTESLMIAFQKQGHTVSSLSQADGNFIHAYLRTQGIGTFTYSIPRASSIPYFFKQLIFFIRFCRKHNIQIVYSHLESANFVAAVAQYLVKAKVYIVRHHVEEAALQGFDKSFFYRATYALAKKIIVVSNRAAKYMVEVEKIDPTKILKINLAYDFSLYNRPDQKTVDEIRKSSPSELILLSAGRLNSHKRTRLSIQVLKRVINSGIDAKLIILGSGEEELNLKKLAEEEGVLSKVIMPGYINNITDYLAASDLLLHPSSTESSCVIVKEAAITDLPVIVCHDVGDFDDYIIHKENAFIVGKDNFVDEAVAIIVKNYSEKKELKRIAANLKLVVLDLFGIEKIVEQYKKLNA